MACAFLTVLCWAKLSPWHAAAGKLEPLSSECHEEVLQVKILRSKSLDANPTLGECWAVGFDPLCIGTTETQAC